MIYDIRPEFVSLPRAIGARIRIGYNNNILKNKTYEQKLYI